MSRISELPLAQTVNDTDEVEVNQNGVSRRARANTLPAAAVNSVNGETGAVVLDATDIAIAALSPSNYTPDGSSIEEHLSGIDDALATAGGASSITDLSAITHRLFYSDGSGNVVELAFGTSGQVLKSNGASSAPSFQDESGGGGSTLPVADTTNIVKGSADDTKLWRVEVDGFTASTTRVLTPADRDWSPTVFGEELTEVADASAGRTKLDAAQSSHNHAAGAITSGTFADPRIAQSNVKQHEAALSITLSQVTNSGDLAAQDTVNTQHSVTGDGVGTPVSLVNDQASPGANKTYGTDAAGVPGYKDDPTGEALGEPVNDASTSLAVDDTVDGTHRVMTADTAITATLDAQGSVGTRVGVEPGGDGTITVEVESSAGSPGYLTDSDPKDQTPSTTAFTVTGYAEFRVDSNSDGDSAVWVVYGSTDLAATVDSDVTFTGDVALQGAASGAGLVPVTRGAGSSQPTTVDSAKHITTDGAITIPNSAIGSGWFHCTLEIGADTHDITHNSLSLDISAEGFTAGEVYTVITKSASAIRVVGPAGTFTESDFA